MLSLFIYSDNRAGSKSTSHSITGAMRVEARIEAGTPREYNGRYMAEAILAAKHHLQRLIIWGLSCLCWKTNITRCHPAGGGARARSKTGPQSEKHTAVCPELCFTASKQRYSRKNNQNTSERNVLCSHVTTSVVYSHKTKTIHRLL